jgi:hypothetical protein
LKDNLLAVGRLAVRRHDGSIFRDREGLAWTNPYSRDVFARVCGGKADITVRDLLTHYSGLKPDLRARRIAPTSSSVAKGHGSGVVHDLGVLVAVLLNDFCDRQSAFRSAVPDQRSGPMNPETRLRYHALRFLPNHSILSP